MALLIRRGTDSQRQGSWTSQAGEIIYTTDTKELWVGDGTQGGVRVAPVRSVNGQTGVVVLNSDNVSEGNTNKYYTAESARDDAGAALVAGNSGNIGITFSYNSNSHTINATVTNSGGLSAVVGDLAPSLGGNLNVNGKNITGTGNISITGNITATNGTLSFSDFGSNVNLNGNTLSGEGLIYVQADATNLGIGNAGVAVKSVIVGNAGFTQLGPSMRVTASRGTLTSQTALEAGDLLGAFTLGGLVNGASNGELEIDLVSIRGVVTDAGDLTSNFARGKLQFTVLNGLDPNAVAIAEFSNTGKFSAPSFLAGDGTAANPSIGFTTDGSQDTGIYHPGDGILCISTDAQERVRVDSGGMRVNGFMKVAQVNGTLPSPAEAGMIVLDGTTFKGYNGSSWVNLN